MRNLIRTFGLLLGLMPILLPAQVTVMTEDLARIGYYSAGRNWVTFHDYLSLDPQSLVTAHKTAFGLGQNDALVLDEMVTEESGRTHHRYDLTHQGVQVEGAKWLIHGYQGKATKANGFLPQKLDVNPTPSISANQALMTAIDHVKAETYMWEVTGCQVQQAKANENIQCDFFPIPNLMIVDTDFEFATEEYVLAYRIEVHAFKPMGRRWIYVNAQDGTILKELDMLHTMHIDQTHTSHAGHFGQTKRAAQTTNEVGTAVTRYSGTRQIVTTNTGNGYILRETNRNEAGANIETYDMNESTDYADAVDFTDDDNFWNATANFDNAAYDAHWGAELTYDYFLKVLGRNSYDNQGSNVISYIHYDTLFFNAFWNGVWMTFGDGNGNPLTPVDVVAHEFAHGVTGNSAGLIYVNESGALNESFSDIFGNVIEHYADPTTSSWLINEQAFAPFRNMQNPNQYGHPSFYKGNQWFNGTGDNGGVHINSGVQNRWFTLLVEGGSGTNENGEAFTVAPLGYETATKIAYRNLNTYLTPTSQHVDAREGAIQAAIDLHGECSPEFEAVVSAWHAVGVGQPVLDGDFGIIGYEVIEPCDLSAEEELTITIKYFGCDSFPGGNVLLLFNVQEPFSAGFESLTVPPLAPLGVFNHTFNKTLDLQLNQSYQINSEIIYTDDPYPSNDSSSLIVTYNSFNLGDDFISFESFLTSNAIFDSVHFASGEEVTAGIKDKAGLNESFGVEMEGGNRNRFSLAFGNTDPFDANPNYINEVCICTDARNMDALEVEYDLRQTYSPFYAVNLDLDSSFVATRVNIFRVLVNGMEVGPRRSPTTPDADPYTTHLLDLGTFVDQRLNICFQSLVNQSRGEDPFGIGDITYLDNINLIPTFNTTQTEVEVTNGLLLFPNPAADQVILAFDATQAGEISIKVRNLLGQEVYANKTSSQIGDNRWTIDVQDWSTGIYLVEVAAGNNKTVEKLIIE